MTGEPFVNIDVARLESACLQRRLKETLEAIKKVMKLTRIGQKGKPKTCSHEANAG